MTLEQFCDVLRSMNRCDAAQRIERWLELNYLSEGRRKHMEAYPAHEILGGLFDWAEQIEGDHYWRELQTELQKLPR